MLPKSAASATLKQKPIIPVFESLMVMMNWFVIIGSSWVLKIRNLKKNGLNSIIWIHQNRSKSKRGKGNSLKGIMVTVSKGNGLARKTRKGLKYKRNFSGFTNLILSKFYKYRYTEKK
ncbi:hypothetical protein OA57_07815 [Chelonobacter oris]|uniref:Uncharacterized protein n=1 Tax=Chelonobacter oris TaxID=505317 RepID=A0A0A3AR57_9PAST|nr:hypothetical protein OA57_07815 [Chelonobacter oris]